MEEVKTVKGYRVDGSPIWDYRTEEQKELERKFLEIIRNYLEEILRG